jgi:hypothetical protein
MCRILQSHVNSEPTYYHVMAVMHHVSLPDSLLTAAAALLWQVRVKWEAVQEATHTYLAILCMDALSNAIYLLVHLCSVVVTLLTSSSNGERHSTWMPSSDTGNLPQALVCLAW